MLLTMNNFLLFNTCHDNYRRKAKRVDFSLLAHRN